MNDAFENHGILTRGILALSPRESFALVTTDVFILDTRDSDFSDYKAFNVSNVFYLPENEFEGKFTQMDKGIYYVLSDSSGLKSRGFAEKMLAAGFEHVAYMSGGFVEWERDGLPVRTDIHQRLSGACACQLKPRDKKSF
jgi:rhodanese-related sulfurtransferase